MASTRSHCLRQAFSKKNHSLGLTCVLRPRSRDFLFRDCTYLQICIYNHIYTYRMMYLFNIQLVSHVIVNESLRITPRYDIIKIKQPAG